LDQHRNARMLKRQPGGNCDGAKILFEEDLSLLEPNPVAAPAQAKRW
jgi:hypothetical protein